MCAMMLRGYDLCRRPRPSPKVSKVVTLSGPIKKHCNCKNSRCLKLYCECFASGRYCDNCNCVNCCNNKESEQVRQAAVEAILERNPNAFRPKIQVRTPKPPQTTKGQWRQKGPAALASRAVAQESATLLSWLRRCKVPEHCRNILSLCG